MTQPPVSVTSATPTVRSDDQSEARTRIVHGWFCGFAGMVIFSGSLPATRLAVMGFDPFFLSGLRAVIAALLGLLCLAVTRQRFPSKHEIRPLLVVAVGCVVGFPLLTALALQHISSARSLLFVGLLPLATAFFGWQRGRERPRPLFWVFAVSGSAIVVIYAALKHGQADVSGDLYMLAAIAVCGLGYAEGGVLSRKMGGWQVICWALVIALPAMLVLAVVMHPAEVRSIPFSAWIGLAYVSVFSMLIGFFFWYRGLALAGIAAVGQLQLLQPFFGLVLASAFLGEHVEPMALIVMLLVSACVFGSKRA